ncbi:hypothetical protein ACFL4N_09710 [Thermodesulfobacteriota bacterium]
MKANHKILLAIDGVVNLALGILLLLFPAGILTLFGLPPTDTYFYASILGAVILGIGIALLLELWGFGRGIRGLGLGGAIVINFCGSGALLAWLLFSHFNIPMRGHIILWAVAVMVLGIGVAETVAGAWKYEN